MLHFWKILVVVGGCLIFSTSTINAQTFEAGVIAGFNLSQLDGDNLAGYNQIGFNVGGTVAITPSERWKWNIELLFSQKGSNDTPDQFGFSTYQNIRLNYAEIPVKVSYLDWYDERGFYKLHFTGGVSYGRLVGFKVIQDEIDQSDFQDFRQDMIDLIIGATFFINKHVGINGQFSYSALNLQANPDRGSFEGKTLSFRGIYIF